MGKLKLPRLISNGVVLQQKKKIHIWGFDEPLRKTLHLFTNTFHSVFSKHLEVFSIVFINGCVLTLSSCNAYMCHFLYNALC